MRTNLIQSYLTNNSAVQQYNSDKIVKDFNVNKELANRTFIKPLPSNGKLVKKNLFYAPAELFKDMKYDMKALKHSMKGEANDHELGRLNDLGMKLGGLGIATYLYARKATPLTKIMEFVGLGSFFAAMDLWPKLAIQLPAYLVHGFDIRQNYEDNYGRKKPVFLDHQFIPWDLYSDDEINKIGDRLRVPKDIPNRREFIQEKMRKIALQNNTMWMLTAGFATPIMSALICNALTSPIQKYQDGQINRKAEELLVHFNDEIAKYDLSERTTSFNKLLDDNLGKSVSSELFEQIHSNLSKGLDPVVSTSLRTDLENMLPPADSFNFTNETLDNVRNILKEHFSTVPLSEEELSSIIPDNESIKKAFTDRNLIKDGVDEFSDHSKIIQGLLKEKITAFAASNPDNPNINGLNFRFRQLLHSNTHGVDSPLAKAFKTAPAAVLNESLVVSLKEILNNLNTFNAKVNILDRYAYLKVAQAPETILANSWNDISEDLLKFFNFTDKEISRSRIDREAAGSILRQKIENIASDDKAYGEFVDNLSQKLSALFEKTSSLDIAGDDTVNSYTKTVTTTYDTAADALRKSNMHSTANAIAGFPGQSVEASAKHIQLSFVNDRISGVKSSFYRLLNTVDMYRRIAKLNDKVPNVLDEKMSRAAKEELVEMCKLLLLDGHTSDYAEKFYALRSLDVNPPENLSPEQLREFYSQIEVKDGKVINRYLGHRSADELVELSNDSGFFKKAMDLMYGEEIHTDTNARIKNSVFYQDFLHYRDDVLNHLGYDDCFAKPQHLAGHYVDSSSEKRFLKMGCALDEMFNKLCKQKFNNRVWLKMFGGFGAGLLGVTVLSQFFMGKMKVPEPVKENK